MYNNADEIKRTMLRWLQNGGIKFSKEEVAIGNEVLFGTKMRRADLLLISGGETHAFEIKSDCDNTKKLVEQINDYVLTFNRVSVVTGPKLLNKILTILPPDVGIILVDNSDVCTIRKARKIRHLDKEYLSLFLDKATAGKLSGMSRFSRYTIGEVRQYTIKHCSYHQLCEAVYELLYKRYRTLYSNFLDETEGYAYSNDELKILCWKCYPHKLWILQ
ncbi:MAG: MmcB family DNA repair protein [Planctomycetia bacterium]|nr:MmcB family DNA repair protein [Planctomycetia bacterium]